MKKIIAAALLFVTGTAFAQTIDLLHYLAPAYFPNTFGPILTITTKAASNGVTLVPRFVLSKSADCGSAMTTVFDIASTDTSSVSVQNETIQLSSLNLLTLIGANQGCIQIDIKDGERKIISTGPISLIWDQATASYTLAKPSSATLDFTGKF